MFRCSKEKLRTNLRNLTNRAKGIEPDQNKMNIMRKYIFCCLISFFIGATSAQETVHLSSTGSDKGDGTSSSPYYSLQQAIENRLSDTRKDTLFVEIASGTYQMDAPLMIDQSNNRPIVFKAKGKHPVFVGGMQIKGWKPWQRGIYRAYVPEVKLYDYSFEQFYINGKRAVPARTPNVDWYMVQGYEETPYEAGVRSPNYATQRLRVQPKDLATLKHVPLRKWKDIKFRFYHKWDNTQKHPAYLNVDSGFVYLSGAGMKPWNPIGKGSRFMMSGYKEALDIPGEWYLDREEGYIYYMPFQNENMEEAYCIAPTLSQLVVFKGQKEAPIRNITFQDISFQYTSYKMPVNGNEPMQAAASIEAGMEFDYAEQISFLNCEMKHTGGYAFWFKRACHNNRIEHCYIADLGAGGVKIGEPYIRTDQSPVTSHIKVHNSIITNAGHVFPCGVGVAIFHSSDNEITHNEISDLLYSGVSIGWLWGYNQSDKIWTNAINEQGEFDFVQMKMESPAVRNLVAYNHIHHIGWGELSDMGAVYTLGESPGTKVIHNVIHDILSYDYGGWGLYTDEGSTGVEMSHNLVYRCKSGGFHQHYGKENKIENNILAYGHYYNVQYTRVEEHTSFSFKHNIILQEKGETLAGPWVKGKLDIDHNLYWTVGKDTLSMGGLSFADWKKKKEPHAVFADPMFVDPANDDYIFRSKRAIRKIGFKPFDYGNVGVYGSESWKNQAKMPKERLDLFKKIAAIRLKK